MQADRLLLRWRKFAKKYFKLVGVLPAIGIAQIPAHIFIKHALSFMPFVSPPVEDGASPYT
jgi:hypothetical protein